MLFVAGEASGDRIVGSLLAELAIPAFGLGGSASAQAGGELIADLREVSAVGALDVVARAPRIARAVASLVAAVVRRKPRAAVLVDFTELNARLGRWLRSRGVKVLWCVAPQVWAWRPGRKHALARSMDRLGVLFSFEEPLWTAAGVSTSWVGHPALDAPSSTRAVARAALGPGDHPSIAILPGSRAGEVTRLLPPMLAAARLLALHARLLLAPSLEPHVLRQARRLADEAGVAVTLVDASTGLRPLLPAFDAAFVCSGTATLECALAGVPPVVAYRTDRVAAALARRMLHTPHVALPNVLLGRRCFPELLQDDVTAARLAAAMDGVLASRESLATTPREELLRIVDVGDGSSVGARTAAMVQPWL